MGRLFWKAFIASWIILVLSAATTITVVHLYRLTDSQSPSPGQRMELEVATTVLRHGGRTALAELLQATRSSMIVIGPDGRDILDRSFHPVAPGSPCAEQETVTTPEGEYLLCPPPHPPQNIPETFTPPRPHGPPTPWEPLASGLLASLCMSALIAWYLARPITKLRAAFSSMAAGRLDTRVGSLNRSGDELAELGLEFDTMADKLQNLVQGQRHLLHVVSHELRSPLNRMQVAMGIARQDASKVDPMLQRMEREVERLDLMIESILTLSRLNSGLESEPEALLDLNDLIDEIVRDASFEARGNDCTVNFSEARLPQLIFRPRLVSMAVENVIRNALRYCPKGSVVDVITAHADDWVEILICDRGPGVPEDDLTRMFEPFQRGAGVTNQDGFGLGLAIAKGAIDLHHGTITAANRDDGGLCVTIRLPLHSPG